MASASRDYKLIAGSQAPADENKRNATVASWEPEKGVWFLLLGHAHRDRQPPPALGDSLETTLMGRAPQPQQERTGVPVEQIVTEALEPLRRRIAAYGLGVLAALAGLAVTALLPKPLAGPFFIPQFAAVVGAALYGGLGPGVLTMVLSCVGF